MHNYIEPHGDIEIELSRLWSKLLDISDSPISRFANLFDLGGHSLLVIRLIGEIRHTFKCELSVKEVFENSTLAALAGIIAKQQVIAPNAISKIEPAGELVASFAQYRLWLLNQIAGGTAEYNIPVTFHLRGVFDIHAANTALSRIIARHESLRTTFSNSEKGLMQHIQPATPYKMSLRDLRGLSTDRQKAVLAEAMKTNSHFRFDLERDLMPRVEYIICAEEEGYLLFNMHHIASDGWSMGILVQEFTTQYKAVKKGEGDPLSPLSIQYSDYSAWQRNWLQGDVLERQLEYWDSKLAGAPSVHTLPQDFISPEVKQSKGAFVHGHLPSESAKRLQNCCRWYEVTPYMWLHAVLSLVLTRHSYSDDIVIGTPVANRTRTELSPLIGFFANTLVLRTQCGEIETFPGYLEHVKSVNLEAQSHQDIPFEYLVDRFCTSRNARHSPLFQILFTMNTTDQQELHLPELEITMVGDDNPLVKFDLEISAQVNESGISWTWRYDTSLFSEKNISRLNEHTCNLLSSVLANSELRLPAINMMSESEARYLVSACNEGPKTHPSKKLLHDLFEAVVDINPLQTALIYEGQSLSYTELNEEANRLAHFLRQQGVGTETLVGLYSPRCPEMIIGILAILKAGGAYVPLDINYPDARIAYMLSDTGIEHVLSHSKVAEALTDQPIFVHSIDEIDLSRQPSHNPVLSKGLMATSLAYVIYTSGSTGQPKGVMLEHRGAVNMALAQHDRFFVKPDSRVLQYAALGFDAAVSEWVMTLLRGATLYICEESVRLLPALLSEYLISHQITHATLPPVLLHQLPLRDDYSLSSLVVAGEACDEAQAQRWRQYYRVINAYGPTESTVCTSTAEIGDGAISLGLSIANMELFLLTPDGQLAPRGCLGELCISGPGLARGYLDKPEQTASQFTNSFIPQLSRKRLYKTGDLGRLNSQGELVFVGRQGNQVNIRGYRIELGEVEMQLSQLVGVTSTLVVLGGDLPEQLTLIAYVVMEDGANFDEAILKMALTKQLPTYMVPGNIIQVESWPLTVHGKIDKAVLPLPKSVDLQAKYVAPRTDLEYQLVSIWREILKMPDISISVETNFFELGGNSLLAIKFIAEVEDSFAIRLDPIEFFTASKIADCARKIGEKQMNIETLAQQMSDEVAAMSEDEVAILLKELENEK